MRVFKYRGGSKAILRRDLVSLGKSQFYSAPIETLNDPFETKIKIDGKSFEITKILKFIPKYRKIPNLKEVEKKLLIATSNFIEQSKTWGIYSLSKSYKDELLWAYYADSHRGFCIEYNLEKLKEYKIPTEPSYDVEYKNKIPTISIMDMASMETKKEVLQKKLIATKSKRWEHEDEIRIVTGQTGLFDYDYRALKAIYFGYRSEQRFRKLTMRVLRGRSIRYYVMTPKDGSYELERREIEDIYSNAPGYLESISPVEKGIPYIDDTIRPYEDLISGAIEIARREPYCVKVIDAYISGTKGTKNDPVFYVTCERSDGLVRNIFISKSEIVEAKINKRIV